MARDGPVVTLRCRVQPRAKRSAFAGRYGERIRIRVQAPPSDGRANLELRRFLAEAFGVALADVELLAGAGARDKTVRIRGARRRPPELD